MTRGRASTKPEAPADSLVVSVHPMTERDWPAVRRIFAEGIETGRATYEVEPPTWDSWDGSHRPDCRLVAVDGEEVVGWAALSPYSGRAVYAGVAEVSIYVAEQCRGRGVGRTLLEALIECSERAGIWTLQAGIFPQNQASLSLHESLGFRVVGVRERIGKLRGTWCDVVLLERRSTTVGLD